MNNVEQIIKPLDGNFCHNSIKPHNRTWRTLFSGSSEVGLFRLKTGTTYLERDFEFQPLAPITLAESNLGRYLERELQDSEIKIDTEGGISVRLGPNNELGPVASVIGFAYKRLLTEEAL